MVSTCWGKLGSKRKTRIKTFINEFKLAELSFSVSLFFLESDIYSSLVLNAFEILTGSWKSCLFCWNIVGPPHKKGKIDQGDNRNCNEPSEDILGDLSQEIAPYWRDLGRKLKVPKVKLQAIQSDNIQFPGVTDKAFEMLSAWIDQGQATFHDLSKGLKGLGKKKLADKYCSTSWAHFMTVTKRCLST